MLHVAISLLLYALAAIYVGKLSRKEVERGKPWLYCVPTEHNG